MKAPWNWPPPWNDISAGAPAAVFLLVYALVFWR